MPLENHYQRPQIAVGGLVVDQNQVLLVKRANPPAKGVWALPGGRIQWGETMVQAVEREILEETNIAVKATKIIYTFDNIVYDDKGIIRFHYVIIDFLAHLLNPQTKAIPGDDAEDAQWVDIKMLSNLPVSKKTLDLIYKFYPL